MFVANATQCYQSVLLHEATRSAVLPRQVVRPSVCNVDMNCMHCV